MNENPGKTLEIDGPSATCGHCRFTTALTGKFSVEDGLLVWRAAADLQPGRGPDLDGCCESSPVIQFEHITVDGKNLSAEQIAALRQTAVRADSAEMAAYQQASNELHDLTGD
jgi:hypothetical protein